MGFWFQETFRESTWTMRAFDGRGYWRMTVPRGWGFHFSSAESQEMTSQMQMLTVCARFDVNVKGMLLEIYDTIYGERLAEKFADGDDVLRNHDLPDEVVDDLRFSAFSGALKIETVPEPKYEFALPEKPMEAFLGPSKSTKTWFSLTVIDEVGAPVDGIKISYLVGGERRVVTADAAGVTKLEGVEGGLGTAGLANVAEVREKLKPRWAKPREPEKLEGERVTVASLMEGMDPVSLESEKYFTLVLRPYSRCNEISGAHFAFGKSFVRSSALETLGQIAKALSADDSRKAMIFGHTDLAGGEALNKELSERRAKALYALFTQDSGMWEELYSGSADGNNWHEKWDVGEAQHMLNAVGCTDDEGNKLAEDGVRGPKTIQAIHRFQAGDYLDCPEEQAPLATSDTLGVEGRKELFLAYAKRISKKPVDPGRISKIGEALFMGCGEYNPLSEHARDQESRRAVVFVYAPAAEPQGLPCKLRDIGVCQGHCDPPEEEMEEDGSKESSGEEDDSEASSEDGAGGADSSDAESGAEDSGEEEDSAPPYRCEVYHRIAKCCPSEAGEMVSQLRVRLHDDDANPITESVQYRVGAGSEAGQIRTSQDGWITISLPEDQCVGRVLVEWGEASINRSRLLRKRRASATTCPLAKCRRSRRH